MTFKTVETPETEPVRLSLRGVYETRTRRIRAYLQEPDAITVKPRDLIGETPSTGPAIPELGAIHPNNSALILQTINGDFVPESHTAIDFVLVYHERTGDLSWPNMAIHRKRVRVMSEQTRMFVDLDGRQIGNPYYGEVIDERPNPEAIPAGNDPALIDPDADVGALVRAGKSQFDIELAGFHAWSMLWDEWVNVVNSVSFFGAAPGTVQYVGGEFDEQYNWATQQRDRYSGILHFVRGMLTVGIPGGAPVNLHLDERIDIEWRKRILANGNVLREPLAYYIVRVHPREDLSQLVPAEPGGLAMGIDR